MRRSQFLRRRGGTVGVLVKSVEGERKKERKEGRETRDGGKEREREWVSLI
jgi:hypothetical protein